MLTLYAEDPTEVTLITVDGPDVVLRLADDRTVRYRAADVLRLEGTSDTPSRALPDGCTLVLEPQPVPAGADQ